MYAVGKLGSYISRGVYTVSGPFHPFGGAVDIIVVQQQDGSFKSSPWYVRFGKFQGVLKTSEKIVSISVNGVDAGFNMYLDHKGEAFFLREPDNAEGDFVLSPPTSGDETDVKMRNGRLNKVQSLDIESAKEEEPASQVDIANGNIATRTDSRRSKIFGLMFGRRSMKDNAKMENTDKVDSLERAEIAVDLLEMNWSTNFTSNDQRSDTLQEEPSENCESSVPIDDEETHSLPDGLGHDEVVNSHGRGIGTLCNNQSEEIRDCCSPCIAVQEQVVQIRGSEIGNLADSFKSISHHETSECVFRNNTNDSQICSSNFVNTYDNSLDSHGEQLDDCRNHRFGEIYFEEISSREEIVEIFTLDDCHVIDRSELASEMSTVASEDIDTRSNYDNRSQSLDERCHSSITNVSVYGEGENEVGHFSYSGSTESSVITVDSGIKSTRHVDLQSNGLGYCSCPVLESGSSLDQEGSNNWHELSSETTEFVDFPSAETGQCMNSLKVLCTKRVMISELEPVSESGASTGRENLISCAGMDGYGCSDIHDNPQQVSLINGASEGPTDDSDIQLCPSLTYEEKFNCAADSPIEELVTSETKTIGSNIMTKEIVKEKEKRAEAIDYFGNPFQIEEETLDLPSFLTSASIKPVDSVDAADSSIDPTGFRSFYSRFEGQGLQDHIEAVITVASSSLKGIGQKSGAISDPRTPEDSDDPLKCLEDIQFPCSDTESCGAIENDFDLSVNGSLTELDDAPGLIAGVVRKEHDLKDQDDKQPLEGASEVSRFHSDPINISGCRTGFDGTQLSAMSLPIIRSYSNDVEGSSLFHPLGCSLYVKSDIYKLDVLKNEYSRSSEPELDSEDNEKQVESAPESADTPPITETLGEQKGIPINADLELSPCKHLLFEGTGAEAARQAFDAEKEQTFEAQDMIPVEGTSRAPTQPGRSWRIWPFSLKRSRTISAVQTSTGSAAKIEADLVSRVPKDLNSERSDMQRTNSVKKLQSLTPTSEELASLGLKEGGNVINFSFSTPMLGLQQVDARIYLWKWNSRIVISDVDGTITKSDVLGQFMPLVGIDWSQTGVAHLFSAIKENGYQLLFLSARAISQAHLTRQFLFNLKQDGKALPDGPVVISPDGLFPSLYREVIRRAPHEFKISCLEAIKAVFPPDHNPFYAGFGNRDTDEISYLKVGIPLGKIFIINPKGQVAVNRRVDTKSYTSLHELVNAMFPLATSDEQEDYNSWNYWKLPLTKIDI